MFTRLGNYISLFFCYLENKLASGASRIRRKRKRERDYVAAFVMMEVREERGKIYVCCSCVMRELLESREENIDVVLCVKETGG